ncbi:hypothetical protein ACSQ67_015482 [Phaseolus vulgaris]
MDRAHAISSPNVSSLISGANLCSRKLSTNSIYYASMSHHLSLCHRTFFESESQPSISKNTVDSVKNFLTVLYQFIYPYATYGRLSAAISGSLIAVQNLSDISPLFLVGLFQALFSHLFMDLYVNGVNQVFDFEIDKGFGVNLMIGSPALTLNLLSTFILWTGYSANLPFLRWKRYPVLAALFMFLSWTFIFPLSYFLHMQTFVFKRPVVFPRSLMVSMVFNAFYSIGLALAKDIPDIEGDKQHGIDSFSIRLGQKKYVFWISFFLYEMAFGVAFLAGATSSSPLWIKIVTSLGSFVLASILWYQTKYVDVTDPASTRSSYKFNWKLMVVSFFLLPLIR